VLYHDKRVEGEQLKTPNGNPIHSFVLVVEVKQHSPDLIKFEGPKVHVRYEQSWTDATEQCDQQTWALKRYQAATYKGKAARNATFVQRAIWLARAPNSAFDGVPATGSVPIQFAKLDWNSLTAGFKLNRNKVKTLVDEPSNPRYHSIETLFSHLMYKVNPTRLDLRRVDALTLMRFDAEKTTYIQNMGTGLLLLRGRAGTGKTFALLQIALHLARQGKRTVMLTYNHGLIADINRALRFIGEKSPDFQPLPKVQTRYTFIRDIFQSTFGQDAENIVVKSISNIADRESYRTQAILDTNKFLESVVPADGAGDENKKV
jgi:Uncharacterized conserved protein (DUF2075)